MPTTPLALNIAGSSFHGIAYLQELLIHSRGALRKLMFEVKSQEIIRDQSALKLLKELQSHGATLAVDYFGGGTAMLEASKTMGFGYVKLDDRKFLNSSSELDPLLQTAKALKLPLVMEFVETDPRAEHLWSIGITYLQGYGLAMPQERMMAS